MENHHRRQLWADALLLLVTLIWGSTFLMVKDAVASFPVFPFIALRFIMATVALIVIGWRRIWRLDAKGWGAGILIGLFLFGGYAFQTFGLVHTTASKAGFITGLYVVMVPVMSALILRKRPAMGSVMGVVIATIGLALLSLNDDLSLSRGDGLILLCALSFALHIIAVGAFAAKSDPIALTFVQVLTVSVISIALSIGADRPLPTPSLQVWGAAAFTGVLATAVAFGLQTSMQRFTSPTHTALIFTGEPVFAALFGVALGGDVLSAGNIAGGVLIICGTLISEVRWSQRTAVVVSRFLSPHYVAVPLLLVVALNDPISWKRGLLWTAAFGMVCVVLPLLVFLRQLRIGGISDWHVSKREERVQPVLIAVSLAAVVLPVIALRIFDGPLYLLALATALLAVVVVYLAITFRWKISQHVSGIAFSTTMVTAVLGIGAAPVLLLIPLVAWARVKVGAHTLLQTIAGGLTGVGLTVVALRAFGLT